MPEHPGFDCLWPAEGARLAVWLAPGLEVGIAVCGSCELRQLGMLLRARTRPHEPCPLASIVRLQSRRAQHVFLHSQFFKVIPGKP